MIQVDTNVRVVLSASSWTNLGRLKPDLLDSMNLLRASSQFTQVSGAGSFFGDSHFQTQCSVTIFLAADFETYNFLGYISPFFVECS